MVKSSFKPIEGIYALADPTTHRVMYIGQSMDIDFRYRQHCSSSWSDNNLRKSDWFDRLMRQGKEPELIVLEECDSFTELNAAERKWIHEYKARGEAELNVAAGGGGIRAGARTMNTHREEWFQFARKVKDCRTLLLEIRNDMGRMASVKHFDAVTKLARKLDKEVGLIEGRVRKEFPEWKDVSQALLETRNPGV